MREKTINSHCRSKLLKQLFSFFCIAAEPPVPPCKKRRRGRRKRDIVLFLGQTQRCLGLQMSPFQDNNLPESCHRPKTPEKHHPRSLSVHHVVFILSLSSTSFICFHVFLSLPVQYAESGINAEYTT